VDAGAPTSCRADWVIDLRAQTPTPTSVHLAGDFNDWSAQANPMSALIPGVYVAHLELDQGDYGYKFVLDGATWLIDPVQPRVRADGEGNTNSLLRHGCRVNTDAMVRLAHRFDPQSSALIEQSFLVPPGLSEVQLVGTGLAGFEWALENERVLNLSYGVGLDRTATLVLNWSDGSTRRLTVGPEISSANDWRRGTLYFAMIDRFVNGVNTNDQPFEDVAAPINYQGGDLVGLTQRIQAGGLDDLQTKVLWLTWPMLGPARAMPGERLDLDPRQRGCGLDPYDESLPRQPANYTGFHGYWPVDLQEVDPRFGTSDELEALVQSAHARGIAVLLDLPANHLHEDHPIARDEQKRSWFNYPAQVCGRQVAWDDAPETCWFTEYLPDLNLGNAEARSWLVDQALTIAERFSIDGFRIDAVKHLDRRFLTDLRHAMRARHELAGQPFWTIGETFSGDAASVASYVGETGVHAQFDFPTNYQLLETFAQGHLGLGEMDANVRGIKANYSQELMVNFVGNHDIARFTSLASAQLCGAWDMGSNQALGWHQPPVAPNDAHPYKRLLQALTYAFTIPGQPMIYYGDEFGMPGGGDPDNRRMMRFDEALSDHERWLREQVVRLTAVRQQVDSLRSGTWPSPAVADQQTLAYVRTGGASDALVIINRGPARSLQLALIEEGLHGALVEALSGAQAQMDPQAGHRFELEAESVQIWTRAAR
jgi:glycosidase